MTYAQLQLSAEDERAIEAIVDQLVFAEGPASNEPVLSPGARDSSPEYAQRHEKVRSAFAALTEMKLKAFPVLVKHLDDERQSINFRNHYIANSVGDACRWNIYYQLQDRPKGYSSYGYQREGKDGKNHPKPYWTGTPFDESGGVAKWLRKHRNLGYAEMQIQCLNWLLDREKAIGASDADSYFRDILPLELQILRRRLELGDGVSAELQAKEKALQEKDASIIPPDLLPAK